jgi:tetratricopeptide (TPR) repeat protein
MTRFALIFSLILTPVIHLQAQDVDLDPEPPYDMGEIEAYSIYYDSYTGEDFEMARMYGEWMLAAQPGEIEGHDNFSLENQFRRMITVYSELADQESDPSEQSELYDHALWIFSQVEDVFGSEFDEYEWAIREGRFYQEHHQDLDQGLTAAYEQYEHAFSIDPVQFAEHSDGYYAGLLLDHYVSEGEAEQALELIEAIEPHASPELANSIDEARDNLYDDPEERADYLEEQLADGAVEDDEATLRELATLYEELGDRDEALSTAERLYEMNPDFENTRTLADIALSDADYRTAINYFEEAIEQSPDDQIRAEIARQMSEAYQNLDELQSARDYARTAIEAAPDYGDAYLRMSSVYASVISDCTSDRDLERDDRTVYWLVLDYLDAAVEADPSTASTAEQRRESYEAVMPSTEDKFFMDWEDGDSFQIDAELGECYAWIDEQTEVR